MKIKQSILKLRFTTSVIYSEEDSRYSIFSTYLQIADTFTKAIGSKILFLKHRDIIFGRSPSDELAMYLASVHELYHHNRTNDEIYYTVHFHANYKPN